MALCECCGDEPLGTWNSCRDHNHQTGQQRGRVCKSCNRVIGIVEAGEITASAKVELVARYLEFWKQAALED